METTMIRNGQPLCRISDRRLDVMSLVQRILVNIGTRMILTNLFQNIAEPNNRRLVQRRSMEPIQYHISKEAHQSSIWGEREDAANEDGKRETCITVVCKKKNGIRITEPRIHTRASTLLLDMFEHIRQSNALLSDNSSDA